MTPEIDAIKTNIRRHRADLVAAERELAGAYGPRIAPLSELFLTRFNCDELRRLLRYTLGSDRASELPSDPCSPTHLARMGAVLCLEAGIGRCTLRTMLLRERPRCALDIEVGLKDWGIT